MNCKQLQLAADDLCKNWNVKVHNQSHSITCAYATPMHQSSTKNFSTAKNSEFRRNINCPFIIRYAKVNYKKKYKKDNIFYKVRITSLNARHTCLLSNSSY